jgi:hypothetical protein
MVMDVLFEVTLKGFNIGSQQGNLDFRGTRVVSATAKLLNDFSFLLN